MIRGMSANPPPLPPARPEPTRKGSRWKVLWIVLAVVLGGLLLLAGLVAFYLLTAKDLPVEDKDRAVLLRAEHLVATVEGYTVDPSLEVFTKQRYFDGSVELDYTYDADDLYVSCTVTMERKASDAKASYIGQVKGAEIGIRLDDARFETRNDLLRFGDDSTASVMRMEGAVIGNMFACRSGKLTFLAIWSGITFEDHETMDALLRSVLERWRTYVP